MLLEREAATETLLATLREASTGRGRMVVIEGEPGIGKTALLQSFCDMMDAKFRVHWGWNDPFTTPRPLGALHDMAATFNSEVGDMLRNGASPDLIFSTVLNALARAAEPSILIFEDLHWADHATLDLIRFLGRRVSLLKVMIVVTIRPTELDRDHPATILLGDLPTAAVTRIALMPLSREAVDMLAGDRKEDGDLYRATGGNPFFVTELLADGNGGEGHLPVSIRDAVWARWSRLPATIRSFLETISILPSGVPAFMLPHLIGEDADRVVDQSIERGLLRRDEKGALIFRHELARQATLERISPANQRVLHARMDHIFAALPNAESNTNLLAQRLHHIALSGNAERLLQLAPKAAAQAALLGAHQQAANHLATALDHVAMAPPPLAAQLYEDWAHETFLAGSVSSDETMRAYNFAISLWRSQRQIERVGLNLCRLARLHWRRGETDRAIAYTEDAVRELESMPACRELALAYSTRSQFLMLQDQFEEAIVWGERAIELSDRLGEVETRIHALNNVGTSLIFSGQSGGSRLLEESLALSLQHEFHDHASRAYTNFSEGCMLAREFEMAERLMTEGISYCVQYDLDAAAHYLLGRHAQLRMEQGRLQEAQMISEGVMSKTGFPRVMRLPAFLVLARVKMRLGQAEGVDLLNEALGQGVTTSEPQRIIPARLALLEAAWLRESCDEAREHVDALVAIGLKQLSSWDLGEMLVWLRRLSLPMSFETPAADLPAPRAAELEGKFEQAASLWLTLDQPYEAALSLMQVDDESTGEALSRAVTMFDEIEAKAAAALARRRAMRLGLTDALPKRRRGPYASARQHPLGLTLSEQKVLSLLLQGLGNKEIARTLSRSLRTIEHQVSSVLGKFNASNRLEVLLRVRSEPWLVQKTRQSAGPS